MSNYQALTQSAKVAKERWNVRNAGAIEFAKDFIRRFAEFSDTPVDRVRISRYTGNAVASEELGSGFSNVRTNAGYNQRDDWWEIAIRLLLSDGYSRAETGIQFVLVITGRGGHYSARVGEDEPAQLPFGSAEPEDYEWYFEELLTKMQTRILAWRTQEAPSETFNVSLL
jgi:hypothetical protein